MHRVADRHTTADRSLDRPFRLALLLTTVALVGNARAQQAAPVAVAPAMFNLAPGVASAAPNALPAGMTASPLVSADMASAEGNGAVTSTTALPPVAFVPAGQSVMSRPSPTAAAPSVAADALPPLYPVPNDTPLSVRHASPIATQIPAGPEAFRVAGYSAATGPIVQPVSATLHKDTLSQGLKSHHAGCGGCANCQVVAGGGPCDPITQVARPQQLCGRCCAPDSWEQDDCYCGTIRTNALHDLFGCGQFVVNSGVVIPSAGGVLGDRLLTGWGVDVAMRSPILPPMPNRRWFGELGVSFMENGGKGSPITTDGTRVSLIGLPSTFINDAFSVRIRDVRRTAFTTGLGMTILPTWLNQTNQRLVSIVPRFGIRWGGAHISDQSTPLVAQLPTTVLLPSIQRTDTFFGLYGSLGIQSTWCHVPVFCLCVRELTLGAQLQYVNDWLDLGDLTAGGQRTISTVSPMLTLAFGF